MGYELEKLEKQYGTDLARYSGVDAPVMTQELSNIFAKKPETRSAAEIKLATDYENLLNKYQVQRREYNKYQDAYNQRQTDIPMYGTEYNIGLEGEPEKDVAPREQLYTPTYGEFPIEKLVSTPEDQAAYYRRLLSAGYTDQQIRSAALKTLPSIKEADWSAMLRNVDPTRTQAIEKAFGELGRSGYGTDLGQINPEAFNYWFNKTVDNTVAPETINKALSDMYVKYVPYESKPLPTYRTGVGKQVTMGLSPDARYSNVDTTKPITYDLSSVPQDFDWVKYVQDNPFLSQQGIDTMQEAQAHYAAIGSKDPSFFKYAQSMTNPVSRPSLAAAGTAKPISGFQPFSSYANPMPATSTPGLYSNDDIQKVLNAVTSNYMPFKKHGGVVHKYETGGLERNDEGTDDIGMAVSQSRPHMKYLNALANDNSPLAAVNNRSIQRAQMLADQEMRGRSPKVDTVPNVMMGDSQPTTYYESPAARPLTVTPVRETPVSSAATDLMEMMKRYMPDDVDYSGELRAANRRAIAENAAFADLINKAARSEATKPDKAEMYFRLAAAFGSPTKTGHFTENLGLAGKELADYSRDVRAAEKADRALKMQLALEAQKLKTQTAREEVGSIRALAAEQARDKRAILTEYLKSGRPQSEAGKAAMDAGLVPGTPEFKVFVEKYIDDKIRSGNIFKEAMVNIAEGQLQQTQQKTDIAKQAEKRQQTILEQKQRESTKLTPKELDLKSAAETSISTIDNALTDLNRAFQLNKNSFDTTLKDQATLTILEQTGSKDQKVVNTKELMNLLKSAMISGASEKLKGVLSDSDIKLLQSVAGLDAKSKTERAQILKNAYRVLKKGRETQQRRLDEITSGKYRETTPEPAGASTGELE